ncbi:hypothetical protein BGZ63DRAFT_171074 [Mariannaea sp. PMI_226]|nr:hypothetical protein BGZ63DRAFT_171074 [Mariannaea sp. PMI_226]
MGIKELPTEILRHVSSFVPKTDRWRFGFSFVRAKEVIGGDEFRQSKIWSNIFKTTSWVDHLYEQGIELALLGYGGTKPYFALVLVHKMDDDILTKNQEQILRPKDFIKSLNAKLSLDLEIKLQDATINVGGILEPSITFEAVRVDWLVQGTHALFYHTHKLVKVETRYFHESRAGFIQWNEKIYFIRSPIAIVRSERKNIGGPLELPGLLGPGINNQYKDYQGLSDWKYSN